MGALICRVEWYRCTTRDATSQFLTAAKSFVYVPLPLIHRSLVTLPPRQWFVTVPADTVCPKFRLVSEKRALPPAAYVLPSISVIGNRGKVKGYPILAGLASEEL